jgi:hypothetical protein
MQDASVAIPDVEVEAMGGDKHSPQIGKNHPLRIWALKKARTVVTKTGSEAKILSFNV